jgi:hypothetical protein
MRGVGATGHLRVELASRYHRPHIATEAAILEDPGDVGMTSEKGQIPGLVEEDWGLRPQSGVNGIGIILERFVVGVEMGRPDQFSPLR